MDSWCHIHAQYLWHSEARIEGSREALTHIRDAIDHCLKSGMDTNSATLFAADGESYSVKISVRKHEYLEQQTLPYTAHWACGVGAAAVAAYLEEEANQKEILDQYNEVLNS
jgi:Lhr-like helicase